MRGARAGGRRGLRGKIAGGHSDVLANVRGRGRSDAGVKKRFELRQSGKIRLVGNFIFC